VSRSLSVRAINGLLQDSRLVPMQNSKRNVEGGPQCPSLFPRTKRTGALPLNTAHYTPVLLFCNYSSVRGVYRQRLLVIG
jgi:hypothetical protein